MTKLVRLYNFFYFLNTFFLFKGDETAALDGTVDSKSAFKLSSKGTSISKVPEFVALLLPPIDFQHIYRHLLHLWDTGITNISSSDANDCFKKSYNRWYLLPEGTLPTATLFGIKQPCKTQPPYTRSFDDDCVLYAVLFVTDDDMHKFFCVHTTTKSRVNGFYLLEYNPELCMLADIPSIPDEINRVGEFKCGKISIPRNIDDVCISKSFCRLVQRIPCGDFTPIDNLLQSKLDELFSPLKVEMDGVNASIVDTSIGQFYYKGEYLRLKAIWTTTIEELVKCGFPCCDSMLVALWLYAHGCPLYVHDGDILLQHVSDIVQAFDVEDIPCQSFVNAMEEAGYWRPFARMIAKFLSRKTVGFDFTDIVRGIATPLSNNSYLLCKLGDEMSYYSSSIRVSSPDNLLVADQEKQCFISIAGGHINIPLIARAFQPDMNWKQKDFACHTYNVIMELLTSNTNHCVLGHVTSEQNIIAMCSHEKDESKPHWKKMRGMTVLASNRNKSSCGNGMYFFRMSAVGNFEVLSNPEIAVLETPTYYEFQGFMYALTRAFGNSTRDYHLAPAVLLSTVSNDTAFVNAYSENLPLLSEKCTCPRRFLSVVDCKDDQFHLAGEDEVGVSVGEAAAVVYSFLKDDPERLNAAALRMGLVDLETAGAFEAFVSDGTIMTNLKIDLFSEISNATSPSSLFQQFGFNFGIEHWRRQMYTFNADGDICDAIVKTEVLNGIPAIQYLPREYVITSQKRLLEIFSSNAQMYVIFVDSPSEIDRKIVSPLSVQQKYPDQLLPKFVKRNSQHPYHIGRRMCGDSSSSCTRTDIDN